MEVCYIHLLMTSVRACLSSQNEKRHGRKKKKQIPEFLAAFSLAKEERTPTEEKDALSALPQFDYTLHFPPSFFSHLHKCPAQHV